MTKTTKFSELSNVKKSIITAVCIALAVVLPMAFHTIPNAGAIFCPMHIPVLLCGIICGAPFGLLCGLAGPLLSSIITGMPPAAILPGMICELSAYGFISGIMMSKVHTKKLYGDLYISLVVAMAGGKILAGAAKALIFAAGSYSMTAWMTTYFVTALPAITIQLIFIPSIVFALEKAKLIPTRYKKLEA